MAEEPAAPPVACSLDRDALAGRAARWRALAARSPARVARTAQGLRLSFADGPGVAGELRALAELERDCCGFAHWSVRPGDGQVTVEVSADSPVAVAAVQAMFTELGRPAEAD